MCTHHWASVAALVGALLLWGYALHQQSQKHRTHNRLSIVCTTSMIADAVHHIGGAQVSIECLMGPGIDPHVYRAREGDVHRLARADLVFYNGLHLEGKMVEILANFSRFTPTVAVTATLAPDQLSSHDGFANLYDPHIWLDVTLWMEVVRCIGAALCAHDPQHTHHYQQGMEEYLRKLQMLHESLKATIATLPREQRILVTAHDAFGYFGRTYGFQVVGLQGMSTEADISSRDIVELIDFLVTHQVPAIFVESSIAPRALQAVQQGTQARGHTVILGPELFSDALGTPGTLPATYIGMMEHNVNSIVHALTS